MNLLINRNGYTCIKAMVNGDVKLIGYGDLHIGASTYNEKKALEVRDYIKEEDCIWVGMGDFIENASKRSVGAGVYEQTITPTEQVKYVKSLLEPIKTKCIGCIKGNHEERSYKDSGIDLLDIVSFDLEIPYCEWEFFGIISAPKRCYTVYAVHSYTASKSAGLALNKSEDLEKMVSVDIMLRGHTHKRAFHLAEFLDIDVYNNTVAVRERANVITGHFLERDKSYAASKPLRGDPAGTIALELNMNRGTPKRIRPIYL
jgi:predicted phosphodiesterase